MSHSCASTKEWKSLVRTHLGKQVMRNSESLLCDILAVDSCIKPAYLYDVGRPDSQNLINLLSDMQTSKIIQNNLNVLEIGMDCLVVNVSGLREQRAQLTSNRDQLLTRVINITAGIPCVPCICSENEVVTQVFEVFMWIVEHINGNKIQACKLPSSLMCNISTLFGLLLTYPVLYWYDPDGCQGNCLSMEPLDCVRVTVSIKELFRDDYEDQSVGKHLLFSFSYPTCLRDHVQMLVKQWFYNIEQKTAKSDLFHGTHMTVAENVFESVNL